MPGPSLGPSARGGAGRTRRQRGRRGPRDVLSRSSVRTGAVHRAVRCPQGTAWPDLAGQAACHATSVVGPSGRAPAYPSVPSGRSGATVGGSARPGPAAGRTAGAARRVRGPGLGFCGPRLGFRGPGLGFCGDGLGGCDFVVGGSRAGGEGSVPMASRRVAPGGASLRSAGPAVATRAPGRRPGRPDRRHRAGRGLRHRVLRGHGGRAAGGHRRARRWAADHVRAGAADRHRRRTGRGRDTGGRPAGRPPGLPGGGLPALGPEARRGVPRPAGAARSRPGPPATRRRAPVRPRCAGRNSPRSTTRRSRRSRSPWPRRDRAAGRRRTSSGQPRAWSTGGSRGPSRRRGAAGQPRSALVSVGRAAGAAARPGVRTPRARCTPARRGAANPGRSTT